MNALFAVLPARSFDFAQVIYGLFVKITSFSAR